MGKYILNTYKQAFTGIGLFFGKMGIAITLAEFRNSI